MNIVITRSMNVMNSKGENEHFEKTPEGEFRDDIDTETYGRLFRAGAAALHANQPSEGPGEAAPDLDAMTKEQLVSFAEANTIVVDASAKKADILTAIKAHQAGTAE